MINKKYAELLWNGKYSESWFKEFLELRKKATIHIDKPNLSFQKVETINQPRVKGGVQRSLFPEKEWPENYPKDWKNLLVWGDNKLVMSSLLHQGWAGKINLIYIDPPFSTGQDYSVKINVGERETVKQPSIIEEMAYRNTWYRGISSFINYLYERIYLMKELLNENGFFFIRIDYHVGHYIKIILDEIFGYENFRNEIIVNRFKKNIMSSQNIKTLPTATDSIFVYSKNPNSYLNKLTKQLEKERKGFWRHMDDSAGKGGPKVFFGKTLYPPTGRHWKYSQDNINRLIKEGKLILECKSCGYIHKKGPWQRCKMCGTDNPRPKYWVEPTKEMIIDTNWTDIPGYTVTTGYPTENSEVLLKRIIQLASNPGDIVADFFCGSGTTGAVAEKLGRRWIMSDLSKFAIHTTRKRLMDIHNSKDLLDEKKKNYGRPARPFEILNIGNYELEYFQQKPKDYLLFMLKLYGAEPITGFRYIHGKKGIRLVHIGSLNAPVTMDEVKKCILECAENNITKLDILGWEWNYEVNDLAKQLAKEHKIDLRLIQIPSVNEIKSALVGFDLKLLKIPEQIIDEKILKNIRFSEVSYLEVEPTVKGRKVTIKITDFQVPPSPWLDKVKDSIKKYSDLIDYWAIDWAYQGDTFHNQWQAYRTKKNRKLDLEAIKTYKEPGNYEIMIKVVDVFGNDTNKIVKVKII